MSVTKAIDTQRLTLFILLILSLTGNSLDSTETSMESLIAQDSIIPLQKDLAALKVSRKSSTARRRTCKNVLRTAMALIKAKPKAPNRFVVHALILGAQRSLLEMEKTQRNRDAFYKTCEALSQAPDRYSSYRLSAELLLSDRDLSAKNADAKDRIKALEAMVARYRDTPSELNSLKKVIQLAPKLGATDLKEALIKTIARRLPGDHEAIAYRRKLLWGRKIEAVFSGTFQRLDGSSIVFPQDRLGHPTLVVFWSKESPVTIQKLKQLREEQKKRPKAFEIYSFNLDKLPDCGQSVLESIGLQCTVLKVPNGKLNQIYQTYAGHQPTALRVNHLGFTMLSPTDTIDKDNKTGHKENKAKKKIPKHEDSNYTGSLDGFEYPITINFLVGIDEFDRYFTQLRSLFIGDFLLEAYEEPSTNQKNRINRVVVKAIYDAFVKPPLRYRLSKEEELASYKKANELALKAIADFKLSPDRWLLHNYRLIALMGIANLSGSTDCFEEAQQESRKVLELSLPKGADVAAHFCLAMASLRDKKLTSKSIINGFFANCGGKEAGSAPYGAACILAIVAGSRDLYNQYRTMALESMESSPSLDPLISFLGDRYQQLNLFRASPNFKKYTRIYRFVETNHLINNGLTPLKDPLPPFELKTLDGATLSLPDLKADVLTALIFVEPPTSGNKLLLKIYSPPPEPTQKRPNPHPSGILGTALTVKNAHFPGEVKVITVFLSDDINRVKAIRDANALSGSIALLPGGLKNPMVNRLGILSADRDTNIILIRRDGTIAWRKHGLPYHMIGKNRTGATSNGLIHHIVACQADAGCRALKASNYKRALRLFTENIDKRKYYDPHKWNSSLAHGRAWAYMGLKDSESALKEIDTAIAIHVERSGGKYGQSWQFNHDPNRPCSSMIHLLTTKALILDHLDRESEAKVCRKEVTKGATDYPSHYSHPMGFTRPYEVFEDKMSLITKDILTLLKESIP